MRPMASYPLFPTHMDTHILNAEGSKPKSARGRERENIFLKITLIYHAFIFLAIISPTTSLESHIS